MRPDMSVRFQAYMEFSGSTEHPGLIALHTVSSASESKVTDFSTADLAELRSKIDALIGTPPCSPCADERHEDCPQHHRGGEGQPCGCDQRTAHREIFAAQVALYRAARGR